MVANPSVPITASQVFQWYLPTSSAMTMAVTPPITPVDRSNSPPIISSPTGTARMPKNAACCVQAARPVWLSQRWLGLESVMANRTQTATAPISAPASGRRRNRVTPLVRASRSSAAGLGGAPGVVGVGVVALMICVTSVPPPDGPQGPPGDCVSTRPFSKVSRLRR
jgi:hypothetical protein